MTKDNLTGFGDLAELDPAPSDFDPEKYVDELSDFDLTEEQKIELLEIIWSIMRTFVELGFDAKNWGQIFGESSSASTPESDDAKMIPSPSLETPSETPGEGSAT